jgi:ribosomal protein S18 acetylase RimI-like enzyme
MHEFLEFGNTLKAMEITPVTIKDINQLALLFDSYRVFYKMESDIAGARVFISERIKKSDSIIFAARVEDAGLVGFVQLYPLFSSTRMKRLWLLNDLYISPLFRGRKISLGLIDRAKQHARETGAAGLSLETAKSNLIGNSLYKKADFVLDEDHNFYSWNV